MVLDKLLGGNRKPFLVLSEESNTDVVIAPTRPEELEADDVSAASEAPILFAQGVATADSAAAPAKPAAPKAQPAAAKAQPKPSPAQPEKKVLTTAELLAAERAQKKAAPVRVTETFAAELLNPAKALPRRRRRPGAALAGFKAMVGNLQR